MPRKDKDFIPAFVLNTIAAAASCPRGSWEEVREKAWLGLLVSHHVQPFKHTSVFAGGVGHQERGIAPVARSHPRRAQALAAEGPTDQELANAKSY
jgi:zinc protease